MKKLRGKLTLGEIGNRLAYVDRHLMAVLDVRLGRSGLSDLVALVKGMDAAEKNHGSPIFQILRSEVESQRLALARKWAQDSGIEPNFADPLMFSVIAESCRVQAECMFAQQSEQAVQEKYPDKVIKYQRRQLLSLTKAVSRHYDRVYSTRYFGTKVYLDFEKTQIDQIVRDLSNKNSLLDLGCATGGMALAYARHFKTTVGLDLCPHMIIRAEEKRQGLQLSADRVSFQKRDIETGIPLGDNSVSLIIMNMGTASDLPRINEVLAEVRRVLRKDGKFVFSFYNADSLVSTFEFLPWPAPVAASVDKSRESLEVNFGGKTYLLYARPYTSEEVKLLLTEHELHCERIMSHHTVSAIVPGDLLSREVFAGFSRRRKGNHASPAKVKVVENGRLIEVLRSLDDRLSRTHPHLGSYLLVVGSKV